jgi:hypothetical protein
MTLPRLSPLLVLNFSAAVIVAGAVTINAARSSVKHLKGAAS